MAYYVIAMLISVLISQFIKKKYGFETKKTFKMFISLLPLTLISALRYQVGWDYKNYTEGFIIVGYWNNHHYGELGFELLIKLLYVLTKDPISLFIVMSTLTAYFFSLCYKEYGKEKYTSMYIFLYVLTRYYFCSLNIIRQALAMMIVLYALHYIAEKKYFKYALLVFLAFEIHKLSILYLPLGFILNMNFKKKKSIFLLTMTLPIIVVILYLFLNGSSYMNYFNNMFGNDGTLVYSELIICVSILFSIFIGKNKYDDTNKMYKIFFNMELLVLLFSLLSFLLPTVDRIIWYLSVQNIFLIPLILENISRNRDRLVSGVLIFVSLLIVFLNQTVIKSDSYAILPYNSIFNKQ